MKNESVTAAALDRMLKIAKPPKLGKGNCPHCHNADTVYYLMGSSHAFICPQCGKWDTSR